MNVIFYDAMIMLPIVIVYLGELLDGNLLILYTSALGLTVLLQFYMGYMISFHRSVCLLYVSAKTLLIEGDPKAKKLKTFSIPLLQAVIYSIIGIATASVLLLPVFFNLIESKGQVGGGMTFSLPFKLTLWIFFLSWLLVALIQHQDGQRVPTFPIFILGAWLFLDLSFISYRKSWKSQKMGCRDCYPHFPDFLCQ